MVSERMQRQIDRLLDEAEEAVSADDWPTVQQRANAVMRLDPNNEDAATYLAAAARDDSRDSPTATPAKMPHRASHHPTLHPS